MGEVPWSLTDPQQRGPYNPGEGHLGGYFLAERCGPEAKGSYHRDWGSRKVRKPHWPHTKGPELSPMGDTGGYRMRTDRRADRRTDSRTGGHYAKKKRVVDWTKLSGALRTPRNMVRSVEIFVPQRPFPGQALRAQRRRACSVAIAGSPRGMECGRTDERMDRRTGM